MHFVNVPGLTNEKQLGEMKAQKVWSSVGMCSPVMLVGAASVSAVAAPLLSRSTQRQMEKSKEEGKEGEGWASGWVQRCKNPEAIVIELV